MPLAGAMWLDTRLKRNGGIPLIASLADSIVALDVGRVLVEGPPQDVLNDERVVTAYLGSDPSAIRRSGQVPGPRQKVGSV